MDKYISEEGRQFLYESCIRKSEMGVKDTFVYCCIVTSN